MAAARQKNKHSSVGYYCKPSRTMAAAKQETTAHLGAMAMRIAFGAMVRNKTHTQLSTRLWQTISHDDCG